MSIKISDKLNKIQPSATLAVAAKALELKAAGKDIISLSTGEPDFATPEHIKEAGIKAIKDNFSHYTQVDGIPELKQAIITKLKRDNQLDYNPKQILVSCGAKHSIYNLLQAAIDPDDQVIIPAPFWVSYPDMVILSGGKPVIINSDIKTEFKITAKQLGQAITSKTKLIMLNSPNNPSGIAYNKQELAALGEVLKQHPNILIMSDDIYEHNYWAEFPFANILNACPELYDRTIVINGVSKAYAMTGWRIGYAAGPESLIKAMMKMQSQSTTNPCSIAQKAAVAALIGDQQCVKDMSAEFKKRHDYFYGELAKIDGIECMPADGAFYVFFNAQPLINKLNIPGVTNDVEFAEYLLNEVGIAMVPGTASGCPGYLRASVATSMELLQQAIERIKKISGS